MSTVTTPSPIRREPELLGQTVVVIGGSAGIGLKRPDERARREPTSSSPAGIPNACSAPRASSAR